MYKINLKIKPIEIENIMDTLIEKSYFTTNNNKLARQIGMNFKPLRKHLIIGNDQKTGETVIVLRKSSSAKPGDVLKVKGRGVSYTFDDSFFL